MSNHCNLCDDPRIVEIVMDRRKGMSFRDLVKKWNIPIASLSRHMRHEIGPPRPPPTFSSKLRVACDLTKAETILHQKNLVLDAIEWTYDAKRRAVILADLGDAKVQALGIQLIFKAVQVACHLVGLYQTQKALELQQQQVKSTGEISNAYDTMLKELVLVATPEQLAQLGVSRIQ